MLPSLGQTVFYHFNHIDFDDKTELRTRPATVNDVTPDGLATLVVMFTRSDRVVAPDRNDADDAQFRAPRQACAVRAAGTLFRPSDCSPCWAFQDPHRELVRPHQELLGEPGEVECEQPEHHTWSWEAKPRIRDAIATRTAPPKVDRAQEPDPFAGPPGKSGRRRRARRRARRAAKDNV